MLRWAAAALMVAGMAGQAVAETPGGAGRPVVHVCERGNYAERMLKREHGAAPFVTAAEVLKTARAGGPGWTAPRCMTGLEHARLQAALKREADARRAKLEASRLLAAR